MTRDLIDQPARDRIRHALDETLIVEAAAGTGKTTELVQRLVNVLAGDRARVDRVVAVTFTEKAAGELKLRLRAGLETARQELLSNLQETSDPDRRSRLTAIEHALAHLEEAHVSTIHGFCAELLRERPVEAAIDPRFEVLTEPEAERLYGQAFDLWLQAQLEGPSEGVRRSLRRISRASRFADLDEGAGPTARLRSAGWTLCGWRDFPARWRREPFDRHAIIDEVLSHVHEFADLTERAANKTKDGLYRDTWHVRRVSRDVRSAEKVGPRDDDGIEAALVNLAADYRFRKDVRRGYGSEYGPGVARADVLRAHANLVEILERFRSLADADLAALLQAELFESIHRYSRLKEEEGRLDFVDLLVRARDLLRDHDDARADFQRRFTHVFVDEFQDTDPLQAEILLLLAADDPGARDWRHVTPVRGKLFIVGDPKQSIYRFRRADVAVYQEVRDQLQGRGARLERLVTSFRSSPSIQRVVNAAFEPVMTGDRQQLQAEYVPLAPHRKDTDGQPAIVALSVPKPYGLRRLAASAIDGSLPDAVGAFVWWLVEKSGWTVTERRPEYGGDRPDRSATPDGRVPIAARHVCLLFRRFDSWGQDVTREYVAALEARGVPHLLVGGKTFHAREEVETMRAALAAVEWPDDELSVFATVRGSLFAVSDELLLEYRSRFRRLHPFRIPEDAAAHDADGSRFAPIVTALELLRDLHRRRNEVPVTETIGRLLAETRAHAGFVLRPSGEQALANVLQIAELARQYETAGGISFRGFVEQLHEEAEAGQASEAPILEEGSDGVRLMTVHKAKGLEFPVVILVDITAKLARATASRYVDGERRLCALRLAGWAPVDLLDHEALEVERDRAEGTRLAYVAATRARDLLVVPAVGDEPFPQEGWTGPLHAALYPPVERRRDAEPGPACPRFGRDSVLERPNDEPAGPATVAPGLHWFQAASARAHEGGVDDGRAYSVVWWDPRTLDLDREGRYGLRQEDLVGKDAPPDVVARDLGAYVAWRQSRDQAVAQGRVPSRRVRTVTEHVQASVRSLGPDDTADVVVLDLPRTSDRPAGPRYGALVHAVLAVVPLDASKAQVREVAELQRRILGATLEEAESASDVVMTAIGHEVLGRARAAAASGRCRRETPVTAMADEGILLEGTIDLAFEEEGRWTVVDFKTDRELEDQIDAYRRQVRLYADILASATGQPATAVLMRI